MALTTDQCGHNSSCVVTNNNNLSPAAPGRGPEAPRRGIPQAVTEGVLLDSYLDLLVEKVSSVCHLPDSSYCQESSESGSAGDSGSTQRASGTKARPPKQKEEAEKYSAIE